MIRVRLTKRPARFLTTTGDQGPSCDRAAGDWLRVSRRNGSSLAGDALGGVLQCSTRCTPRVGASQHLPLPSRTVRHTGGGGMWPPLSSRRVCAATGQCVADCRAASRCAVCCRVRACCSQPPSALPGTHCRVHARRSPDGNVLTAATSRCLLPRRVAMCRLLRACPLLAAASRCAVLTAPCLPPPLTASSLRAARCIVLAPAAHCRVAMRRLLRACPLLAAPSQCAVLTAACLPPPLTAACLRAAHCRRACPLLAAASCLRVAHCRERAHRPVPCRAVLCAHQLPTPPRPPHPLPPPAAWRESHRSLASWRGCGRRTAADCRAPVAA
jgi:hypothetical protein